MIASKSIQSCNNSKMDQIEAQSLLQLPKFIPEDPAMWFSLAECVLSGARIDENETMTSKVLCALEKEQLELVRDLIIKLPYEGSYDEIKSALISRLGTYEEQKARQDLADQVLGDGKPSELLARLQKIANNRLTEDNILAIWLEKLPKACRKFFNTYKENTLDGIGELADIVMIDNYESGQSGIIQNEEITRVGDGEENQADKPNKIQ